MSLISVLQERNSLTNDATDLTSKKPEPKNGVEESGELNFVTLQAEKENIFERDYAQSCQNPDGRDTFYIERPQEERKESEEFATLQAEKENIFDSTFEPSTEGVRRETIFGIEEPVFELEKDEAPVEEEKDEKTENKDQALSMNSVEESVIEINDSVNGELESVMENLSLEDAPEEKPIKDTEKYVVQDASEKSEQVDLGSEDSTSDTTHKVIEHIPEESNQENKPPETEEVSTELISGVDNYRDEIVNSGTPCEPNVEDEKITQSKDETDLNQTVNMEEIKEDSVVVVSSRETSFVQSLPQVVLNQTVDMEEIKDDVVVIESAQGSQPDVDPILERTESQVEKMVADNGELNRTTVIETHANNVAPDLIVTEVGEKTELAEDAVNGNKDDLPSSEELTPVAGSPQHLGATKEKLSPGAISAAITKRLSRLIDPQPYSPTQLLLAAAFENLKINSPDETFLSCNDDSHVLINDDGLGENYPEVCNDVMNVTEASNKSDLSNTGNCDAKKTPTQKPVVSAVIEISDDDDDNCKSVRKPAARVKSRRSSGITMESVSFAPTPSPLKHDGHIYEEFLSYSPSEFDDKQSNYEKYLQKKLEINSLKQTIAKLTLECKQREAEAIVLQPSKVKIPLLKHQPQKPTNLVQSFQSSEMEEDLEKLRLEKEQLKQENDQCIKEIAELKQALDARSKEFTELQTKCDQKLKLSEETITKLKTSLESTDKIIADMHAVVLNKEAIVQQVMEKYQSNKVGFDALLEKYETMKEEVEKMKNRENTYLFYIEKMKNEHQELMEDKAVTEKKLEAHNETQQRSKFEAPAKLAKRQLLPKK